MLMQGVISVGVFFFSCYGDHRDLHLLTHPFPTRRSSDFCSAFSLLSTLTLPVDRSTETVALPSSAWIALVILPTQLPQPMPDTSKTTMLIIQIGRAPV